MRIRRTAVQLMIGLLLVPAATQAQQTGAITGRVVEQSTDRPLNSMQVQIVGTQRIVLTNEEGRFLFTGVPAGNYEVLATGFGYSQTTTRTTVTAGQTASVSLALAQSALELDAIVVSTLTGQAEQKRALGNVVGRITAAQIEPAVTTNVSQVLNGRSPSVVVMAATGLAGTSQRIRIRGSNSISLANQPLLIVDGVMVNNSSVGMNSIDDNGVWVGGQETSRWNDLNPSEIENIEIVKGPAAAALYGTAAANGVVLITTRRGRSGDPVWRGHVEYGGSDLTTSFPANFQQVGRLTSTGARVASCNLDGQARGLCMPVADSLLSFNPLEQESPFRSGNRQSFGLNVTGGTESISYYLGAETDREQGVLEPNKVDKVNFRANIDGRLRDNLSVRVTTGYVRSDTKLPFSDNSSWGAVGAGLLGSAVRDTVRLGYFSRHPSHFYYIDSGQEINRFTGGANLNWQALPWLNVSGQAGLDHSARHDYQLIPSGVSTFSTTQIEGFRASNRFEVEAVSGSLSGTATYSLRDNLKSTTTAGGAYSRDGLHGSWANGRQLLAGTGTLGGSAAGANINETAQDIITIGGFLRQQLAWRERVFLAGTLRGDDNSAFGADFEFVTYPGLSASWVLSEESFFPKIPALDQFRLRAAWGQSGQRPGFRQARTFYSPVAVSSGVGELTAVTIGGTGNAILSPERSEEWEAGFELGVLSNRVGFEFTYYDKQTRDALIARRLVPSAGASNTRFENIGRVSNRGFEVQVNAQVLQARNATWDATITASTTRNRLEVLGEGVEPIIFNSLNVQRHTEGSPLGAFFQKTITYADHDGDGMISRANCTAADHGAPVDQPTRVLADGTRPQCEVIVGRDPVYLGTPAPTREVGFNTTVTLFNSLRVTGQLDYKGGHKQYNYTKYFRCSNFQNCETAHNSTAPLNEQAMYVAGRFLGTVADYIEDADFVKLRELAVSYDIPQNLTQRFGAGRMSLTVAGRNLATWTKYGGLDPELNSLPYGGGGDFAQQDFLTLPPTRQWTARLNLTF